MDCKETILKVLKRIRPEYDFLSSTNYIEDGLIDSFDLVTLVSDLEMEYNIIIDGLDIVPENFDNIDSILRTIRKNGGSI